MAQGGRTALKVRCEREADIANSVMSESTGSRSLAAIKAPARSDSFASPYTPETTSFGDILIIHVREPHLVQPTHSNLSKNSQMKIQQWLMPLRTELHPEKK
ncbi:hypothetical protein [Pantoea ananatis]|uniref:hypothetical protein n=1 Tax=Pantoea ananas TaxID=553 RepID=UPI001B307EC0|nr:hypothetical protein [Pantoea ananatis]